jgi:hypothetical protein
MRTAGQHAGGRSSTIESSGPFGGSASRLQLRRSGSVAGASSRADGRLALVGRGSARTAFRECCSHVRVPHRHAGGAIRGLWVAVRRRHSDRTADLPRRKKRFDLLPRRPACPERASAREGHVRHVVSAALEQAPLRAARNIATEAEANAAAAGGPEPCAPDPDAPGERKSGAAGCLDTVAVELPAHSTRRTPEQAHRKHAVVEREADTSVSVGRAARCGLRCRQRGQSGQRNQAREHEKDEPLHGRAR